jgi:UDP-N-acetylmuramyl pentapeptide phosphotransferase/UDP-N-acetylglucosamine-1-phosphate transferase
MIWVVLASFVVSLVLTAVLRRTGDRLARLDHPNERSLHDVPTPRTGGLAILGAAALGGAGLAIMTKASGEWAWIGCAAALIAFVSFLDDRRQVSPGVRLAVQVVAASAVVLAGVTVDPASLPAPVPAWLVTCVIVIALTWTTNLFNFMDGMDGFAGGMAVIGFGTYAWLAWDAGASTLAGVSGVLAAAAAGFLVFNFPPARIFMGDAGSSTLGFLSGCLAILGIKQGVWPWPAALIVFSPFLVDATVTLTRRLLRGEKVWRPHRSHYYQRLVQAGWGHRRTVLWEYVLMLACATTAIAGVQLAPSSWRLLLTGWAIAYLACMRIVNVVEQGRGPIAPARKDA